MENSGELYFCVLELVQAIDVKPEIGKQYHPSEAAEGLDEDEVAFIDLIDSTGIRKQKHLCVNKTGMWAVLSKSVSSKSKEFRRWIRKDVLKSIDEKGSYLTAPAHPQTKLEILEWALASEKEALTAQSNIAADKQAASLNTLHFRSGHRKNR